MEKYGAVAVRATELLGLSPDTSPPQAWDAAAHEVFPQSESSREKGCPRGTFLGLCEEGLVVGVPAGTYTRSRDNKAYGLEAVRLLTEDDRLAALGPAELWRRVMGGVEKRSNSQMDVVLALWSQGLIQNDGRPRSNAPSPAGSQARATRQEIAQLPPPLPTQDRLEHKTKKVQAVKLVLETLVVAVTLVSSVVALVWRFR